ncbi:MAG: hypothetical protein ABSA46_15885 [Thermodesulfovibrionales bacterium]
MKPKKPRKTDPFKGMKKVIPIRHPEKELSFEEKVEKFGQYMHDPEQHGKIFSELGFAHVDDICEGGCGNCKKKADCTVYESVKDFEMSGEKEKKTKKVVPFKKK